MWPYDDAEADWLSLPPRRPAPPPTSPQDVPPQEEEGDRFIPC